MTGFGIEHRLPNCASRRPEEATKTGKKVSIKNKHRKGNAVSKMLPRFEELRHGMSCTQVPLND
jgi:hypothetical protein